MQIEVKTGEENEELLYVHRAKLYRYIDGEWKERGLGDVKILRHKENKKLRVVMRREQIWKICLNHVLNNEVEYKIKDDKSWLFVVHDFSEGEVELQKFTLRFKNKDIAQEFMTAIQKALDGTAEAIENVDTLNTSGLTAANKTSTETNTKAQSEAAAKISAADKQTADKLKLPYEFYTAQPTTACSGCRGCSDKEDQLKFEKSNADAAAAEEKPLPLEMPALSLPNKNISFGGGGGGGTPNRSLLKQSTLSPAPASASQNSKTNESIFSGFGGANSTAFGSVATNDSKSTNNPNSTFSFAAALSNTPTKSQESNNTTGSGGFLFGSTGTDKPAFGQTSSIFGGAKTDKPSIFGGSTNTTSSVFGAKPVFGASAGLFGSTASSALIKSENSADNASNKSIFGNSTQSAGTGGNSIFGGSSTTTFESLAAAANNSNTPIFGSSTNKTSLFGSIKTEPADSTTTPTATFADLSSKAGAVDFASLASKASTTTLTKSTEKPGPGGFIGLTNQDAFSSFMKPNNNNSEKSTPNSKITDANANVSLKSVEDDASAATDDNYDPHYEPIIELPKEIVVSTGEEEETKLFGERATLYRWDATNKEWKERGKKIIFNYNLN